MANELSRRGKSVVLIEKGRGDDWLLRNRLGIGCLLRLEKGFHFPLPVRRTHEGDNVILANCLGGGTLLYAAAAFYPDIRFWQRHGIELDAELIDEAARESWVDLVPEEFIGPGTARIREAANDAGIPFERLLRHINFDRCQVGCERCINGCPQNVKWNAGELAYQAVKHGANLLTRTMVTDIIIENDEAVGVKASDRFGRKIEVNANAVICAAGGTQTARILQGVGIQDAGSWLAGDPTFFTFGFTKDRISNGFEHVMSVGWHDEENGVVFCSMLSPFPAWELQLLQDERFRALGSIFRRRRAMGVFSKVSDEGVGRVYPNGKLSKTFTKGDLDRFAYSRDVNARILARAGCDPSDIHHSGFVLGHPSGTVRVGELLDTNLQTSIRNLYCCDASVMPSAPGQPPTMTIVVLAKRLARHLERVV